MLSGFLEKGGYRPTAWAGLAEAAAAFGATPPDLFVSGLEAPHLEGWRLCRRLRSAEYPAFDRTPMLLVSTTVAGEEAARATLEAGGDELLAGPLEETRLIEAIRRLPARGHNALAAHPGVERETMLRLMRLLNAPNSRHELIREVTAMLQGWCDCEAVGVRLREGEDFPYFETRGFPAEFVKAENWLCARDSGGELRRDSLGNPVLECMCGNILCGRFNPKLPFFTENGSFWTNCATRLLASTTEADRPARTRNRCVGEGYQSVALIPLRAGGKVLGLLQFNDRSEGRFSPEAIALLERAAGSIGIALEQRQTLAALRKSQERYRLIADFTYDWEFWVGPDRAPLYHSPACERITGYTAAEFMADPHLWEKIIHPDDAATWERHMRDDGPPDAIEFRAIAKSGAEVIIDHACQPVYGDAGEFLGRRGSNRDITGRKRAEGERARLAERLQQSQKLESVGRLAGGVAHTVDDLLSVIGGYSALMLAGLDRRGPLHASLIAIQRSGERAAGLTRQLLVFSGEKAVQFTPLDLNGLVAESRDMLERLLREDIELVTDFEPALGFVLADREQLQQAILNLAANARDAMPNGGSLTLKTANLELSSDLAAAHPDAEARTYAVLSVADTGAGMDPETLRRLFEPFFTTKGEGSGAGLGLAAVYGIVRQCGGWVTAESEPGRGAKFTIGLPRVAATLTGGPPPLLPRAHCEPRKRFS
jgi:PAS domain S-box-containing protein